MHRILKKDSLLLALFAFSFIYRFLLLTWNIFPPGADIGLHESTINSIMSGKNDFIWNYYHMGGGISATNPGYHIFVMFTMYFMGTTDYVVHVFVASFFSAIASLCIFLLVRRMWNEKAAVLAAYLMIFSGGDIGMLSWGGYPNVIALTLMPLIFYFYLKQTKFSLSAYLPTISLFISALFLTHVFSALIFVTITVSTVIANYTFLKKTGFPISEAKFWLTPIFFGVLITLPYLIVSIPLYFGSQGTIIGNVIEVKQAVLETRLVSLEIVVASFIPILLFFLLSKYYRGKIISTLTLLLTFWILIPLMMTQSYLFGFYLDYQRFVYFLYPPVTICIALLIETAPNILAQLINRTRNWVEEKELQLKKRRFFKKPSLLSYKNTYLLFILGLLFFSLYANPIFKTPTAAIKEVNAYQFMTQPKYEAIQWVRQNTEKEAICVAEANYGWWIAGFAQRTTLSAVNPQYLILTHEVESSEIATKVLTAKYIIDNGLIRFQDNGLFADNQYELSATLSSSYFYPFFGINDEKNSLIYRDNGIIKHLNFTELSITDTHVVNGSNQASYRKDMGNEIFTYTREITVYRGIYFAQVSINIRSNIQGISLHWLHIPFQFRGLPTQHNDSIVMLDTNMQTINQIILPKAQLGTNIFLQENPDFIEMVCNLEGKDTGQLNFFTGVTKLQSPSKTQHNNEDGQTTNSYEDLYNLARNNSEIHSGSTKNLTIEFFDYKKAINQWNISYIFVSEKRTLPRFLNDLSFSLIFQNSEVSIFKVNRLKQQDISNYG